MNNAEKMYQELMNMYAGEVKNYRLVGFEHLIRLPRGTYTNLSESIQEEIREGYVTITKYSTMFYIRIISEDDTLISTSWLSVFEIDKIKILTECLTEFNTPDEIQQEQTLVHYIFTQPYFGIPKNSTFMVMSDWLNLDSPDKSLSTFIICTYWKDGKPEEITSRATKDQVRELIANGVIKEEPQSEYRQIYMKVLKLYWSLSEEDRKDLFKLVYRDPSVSQYRYKMDEDVVISVPSKYAPYSDFIPSELGHKSK